MKRSEVKIGAVLFWGTSPEWETRNYDIAKVEVIGLWAKKPGYSRRRGEPNVVDVAEGSAGAGIKVKVLESSSVHLGRADSQQVAQLAHLRGPWDEVQPYRLEVQERAKLLADTAAREKRLRDEKAMAVRERAHHLLGEKVSWIERQGEYAWRVDKKTMELLLDLAAGVEVITLDSQTGEVLSRSYED